MKRKNHKDQIHPLTITFYLNLKVGNEFILESMVQVTETPLLVPNNDEKHRNLGTRVFAESKRLWSVTGPSILGNILSYSSMAISLSFAGHLGDFELASISIALTVIVGFNSNLLAGLSSVLETLCSQAFGAKKHEMLGVYMQRSWIVLFICATLLLPIYIFATPILRWSGQPEELAVRAGKVALWSIPLHYSFVFLYPLTWFILSQLKTNILAMFASFTFLFHNFITWLFVYKMKLGLMGVVMTLNFSWWVHVACLFGYVVFGGCPLSWNGFSMEAFPGIWDFVKFSASSGIMDCLESWYISSLVLFCSAMKNAEIAVDALSISFSANGWVLMIAAGFFVSTQVRVGNELGAGDGKAAKFAVKVSVVTSFFIGLFFSGLIMGLHDTYGLFFTSSPEVLEAVDKLTWLLSINILLKSVQIVLVGVVVGSGWQAMVAYVNIGSYYLIGIPVGYVLGFTYDFGVVGMWGGMIGGSLVQTLVLTYMIVKCDWDQEALKACKRVEKWGKPSIDKNQKV
ncbi:MATE efflux family protein, expressed [Zostera marina]|uniref:Protein DETOXIFICATION n=1 Tax=Zostera marina TaxID=29655 RepID=A0A0K9PHA3_ZOSMR|nr:MATE efflux family protein, expressed [Zostera marina]